MPLALQLYTVLQRLTIQHISLFTYNYSEYNLYMLAITVRSNLKSTKTEVALRNILFPELIVSYISVQTDSKIY